MAHGPNGMGCYRSVIITSEIQSEFFFDLGSIKSFISVVISRVWLYPKEMFGYWSGMWWMEKPMGFRLMVEEADLEKHGSLPAGVVRNLSVQ